VITYQCLFFPLPSHHILAGPRRVDAMEYTQDLVVFDLLHVPMYHGWVVDPHDTATADAFGALTYNQVVEKVYSCALGAEASPFLPENMFARPMSYALSGFGATSRIVRESKSHAASAPCRCHAFTMSKMPRLLLASAPVQ
jgi:hypothetical protein